MKKDQNLILSVLRKKELITKIPALKKIKSVSKLGTGASHLNYLITSSSKKIVLRINIDKTSKNKLKREFMALRLIEKLNIAPKPLHFQVKSDIGSFLLLEYFEGDTLNKTNYILSSQLLTALAKEMAMLHSISISSLKNKLPLEFQNFNYYLHELKEYKKQLRPLLKSPNLFKFMDEMFMHFEKHLNNHHFRYRLCMIHGDVQEQNIILDSEMIKLIDWESAMISDPATEISYIVTQFGKPFSLMEKNKFTNEYLKLRKDISLKERVELYVPIRYYMDFLWSILQTEKIKKCLIYYSDKNRRVLQQGKYTSICIKRMVDANIISKEKSKLLYGFV